MCFSTFLPDDPRFGVGRRGGHGYDCAIVFELDNMVASKAYSITMTCQGNVLVDRPVNAGMFCQYVVRYDVARAHVKQCLYHKALQNEPITGYTGGDLAVQANKRQNLGLLERPSGPRATGTLRERLFSAPRNTETHPAGARPVH